MKKLLENRAVRALAFVLCLVFGLGTLGCVGGVLYTAYEPGLNGESTFPESELAWSYTSRYMFPALDCYSHTGESYSGDKGFSYVIRDMEGKVLVDTRKENSCLVKNGESRFDQPHPFDYEEWDDAGEDAESTMYIGTPYVNLPAEKGTRLYGYVWLYDLLCAGRNLFLPVGIALAVVTLLLFVFLLCAAGQTPEGVRPGPLTRLPLEIWACLPLAMVAGLLWLFDALENNAGDYLPLALMGAAGLALLAGAAGLYTCMSLAARLRTEKWWKNSITWYVLLFGWRILKWLWRRIRGLGRGIAGAVRAVPVGWKVGLIYCGVVFVNLFGLFLVFEVQYLMGFFLFALFVLDLAGLAAAVLFGAQMTRLREAGKALAAGDLSYSVDTSRLWLDLKAHGEDLNAVGLGMSRAVNERMRSERFKTELITNVSHDLKTPLTSIVNYVDLLKKEEVENPQAREYIEVLDRQSQRLKKLTVDLVEASKASSGALTVNLEQVDLAELVRQSVGEYAERFALAGVEPVLSLPEKDTAVRSDGRLLWRHNTLRAVPAAIWISGTPETIWSWT